MTICTYMPPMLEEPRLRTCSEICIDADNNKEDMTKLFGLVHYVTYHKYKYCLVELRFMFEHIDNYITILKNKYPYQI